MFRVVIPARLASSRLPGKALAPIAGKPMVQWVYERARASQASQVIVATDEVRIADAVRRFGGEVMMTSADHRSGTDRIAEVSRAFGWHDGDVVVNVQGDEPLIPPALIDQVAGLLLAPGLTARADIATLAAPVRSVEELCDPNTVKVVLDGHGRALYFSRAPIPWSRDTAPAGLSSQTAFEGARRHIGLYAYTASALTRLTSLPPAPLESLEKLEQLRALENGLIIVVAEACTTPGPDVNTADDLERVIRHFAARKQSEKTIPPST